MDLPKILLTGLFFLFFFVFFEFLDHGAWETKKPREKRWKPKKQKETIWKKGKNMKKQKMQKPNAPSVPFCFLKPHKLLRSTFGRFTPLSFHGFGLQEPQSWSFFFCHSWVPGIAGETNEALGDLRNIWEQLEELIRPWQSSKWYLYIDQLHVTPFGFSWIFVASDFWFFRCWLAENLKWTELN